MNKFKANLLGWGIFVLTVTFIFVLSYSLFSQLEYESCSMNSKTSIYNPNQSYTQDSYPENGYRVKGDCVSYEQYNKAREKIDNQIFASAFILSVVVLAAGLAMRQVMIVGLALTWAGVVAGLITIGLGFESFSPGVQTTVFGLALLILILVSYLRLPDQSEPPGPTPPANPPLVPPITNSQPTA